jgi:hypothetical protein
MTPARVLEFEGTNTINKAIGFCAYFVGDVNVISEQMIDEILDAYYLRQEMLGLR